MSSDRLEGSRAQGHGPLCPGPPKPPAIGSGPPAVVVVAVVVVKLPETFSKPRSGQRDKRAMFSDRSTQKPAGNHPPVAWEYKQE